MSRDTLEHRFVDLIPSTLEDEVLYLSIRYRTAAHLCACGYRVVTPLHPHRWSVSFDGDTVSLHPSIGNGQSPCRSHYFIRHDRILWAKEMTDIQFEAARLRDTRALQPAATPRAARRPRRRWPFPR